MHRFFIRKSHTKTSSWYANHATAKTVQTVQLIAKSTIFPGSIECGDFYQYTHTSVSLTCLTISHFSQKCTAAKTRTTSTACHHHRPDEDWYPGVTALPKAAPRRGVRYRIKYRLSRAIVSHVWPVSGFFEHVQSVLLTSHYAALFSYSIKTEHFLILNRIELESSLSIWWLSQGGTLPRW